jgi:DNA repair protein RadC
MEPNETFYAVFLNNRHGVIKHEPMFFGTIDGAAVYPRVIVKRALDLGAAAIIIAHQHPSGDSSPSTADKRITERLKDALALVDIRLLDHIIIAGSNYTSFADTGLL